MQWLIDIIADRVMQNFTGMIVMWSGSIETIPDGWALCDGNNGAPDLQDKFVQGAGGSYSPGETGGASTHTHTLDTDGHQHSLVAGSAVAAGTGYANYVDLGYAWGSTDPAGHIPPYYVLAYIMKL